MVKRWRARRRANDPSMKTPRRHLPRSSTSSPAAARWASASGRSTGRRRRWVRPSWPQSLRSAVSILLPSKAQIVLFWGPDLVTLYNDAYRPVFGAKHPDAWACRPARPGAKSGTAGSASCSRACSPPAKRTGRATGPSSSSGTGIVEETFFDVSYDPVRDETGAGRRHVLHRQRDHRPRPRRAAAEDAAGAGGRGPRRRRGPPRRRAGSPPPSSRSTRTTCRSRSSTCYEAETATRGWPAAAGLARGIAGRSDRRARRTGRSAPSRGWPFRAVARRRAPRVVTDLARRFGRCPGGAWPEPPHTAVVLPIAKAGQNRLAGFLVAGVSPRRALDEPYHAFLDLRRRPVATADRQRPGLRGGDGRAEALAELDRAKTAFFTNVSHEFRTPLTLMLGPVEDLLAQSHTDLPPAAAGQLEVVNRNGLRLLRLVNTLLDFSRIEAGRVRAAYQPTDLAAFTAELASDFRSAVRAGRAAAGGRLPAARRSRSSWTGRCGRRSSSICSPTPSSSPSRARSRSRCGRPKPAGRAARAGHRHGIPPTEMPRLFERFHRVENARGRTHEGSGIGLALVQELVKLHGGIGHGRERRRRGTTFIVAVPLGSAHLPPDRIGAEPRPGLDGDRRQPLRRGGAAVAARTRTETRRRAPPSCRPGTRPCPFPRSGAAMELDDDRPRVLVADDNADMRQYVVRLLAEQYRVEAVPTARRRWRRHGEQPPDLVLTDVMMPRLDGFGLLRELRADLRTRELPVIMLSARAGEESRVEGMEAGADDYLVKPFSARELLARVQSSLTFSPVRREAERVLRQQGAQFKTLLDQAPIGRLPGATPTSASARSNPVRPARLRRRPRRRRGPRLRPDHPPSCGRRSYADELVRIFRHTLETGEPFVTPERAESPPRPRRHRVLRVAARPHSAARRAQRRGVLLPRHLDPGQRAQGDRREPRGAARGRPPQGRVPGDALPRAAQPAGPAPQHAARS